MIGLEPIKIHVEWYSDVKKAAAKAKRSATIKQLAYIRTRARSSQVLRRRKRVSTPGNPPSVHSKDQFASLKNIRFVYQGDGSGIVGPVKLNQVNLMAKGSEPVPNIHEFGGTVMIAEIRFKYTRGGFTEWMRRDRRFRVDLNRSELRTRKARYEKRPFMSKALDIEIRSGNIMEPYKNVIGG